MKNETYRGVLFDFDGVIIKSMEQHFDGWRAAFEEQGVDLFADEFFILEGQGIHVIADQLGRKKGLDENQIQTVMRRKLDYYNQFMKVELYDYLHDLLNHLQQVQAPMGIVTGGNKQRVLKVVHEHLSGYFSTIVTVDDVERGKPFPDSFLKGAADLGLDPAECVVVENAPLGIKAAKSAGCYVIAVTTTLPAEMLAEADIVLPDFISVKQTLDPLLRR